MPLEKPIKLGPNSYYFHGDLWTADEMTQRWGIALAAECEEKNEASKQEVLSGV